MANEWDDILYPPSNKVDSELKNPSKVNYIKNTGKEEKRPDAKVSNTLKKGLPENKSVQKTSYQTGVRAGFNPELSKRKPKSDFTEVETGLKILSSDQDEFLNVVMTSDSDSFDSAKFQDEKGFETPTKVEATQTKVTSDINKAPVATPTATSSKAPLAIGLGILAYLGFSK